MIRASILGATGYSGGELLKLLLGHSGVTLQHLTSASSAGKPVSDIHPSLAGRVSRSFVKLKTSDIIRDSDVAFSCFPAGVGLKTSAELVKAGVKVVDLSADFRLPTASLYTAWYKGKHTASHLLSKRIYGLPELFRDRVKEAKLIANPGCYATAAILAAHPLLKAKLVDPGTLIVDAKSGVSGAGKKVAFSSIFCEVNENFQAYGIASHRHQPEMECILSEAGAKSVKITFTPHLVPMNRGILSVLYATCKRNVALKKIHDLFKNTYKHEPFIRVLPLGQSPQTKNVRMTNFCDIGVFQDERTRRVIVVSAIDNLIKGAAGQAVQNMNLLFDHPETEGLL